jgi:hypothetical protein
MFHLLCIIFSETCSGKNAKAAENSHIFQLVNLFQRSLSHSRVARATHQAVTIKARVCCVHVCKFSILACVDLAVMSIYQKLVKIKSVP